MNYQKVDDVYFVRIDRNEEIVAVLSKFVETEQITAGKISAIGAVKELEIGLYKVESKKYVSEKFEGDYEIVALNGNIAIQKGKNYLHLHIAVADSTHKCIGGHLNRAVVSATCEVIIQRFPAKINRKKDDEIGLNLLDL